jgi:hypothetical protein
MFEIKFVYVTNDTAEKVLKIGVTEAAYCANKSNTHFFNKLLGFLFKL